MPQDKLTQALLNRPTVSGDVQYPTTGVSNLGDDALRALAVGLGIEDQKPGDAAGALGGALGAVSLIPPGAARARGVAVVEDAIRKGMPDHIVQALDFAQNRWPRLFGHISELYKTLPEDHVSGRFYPFGPNGTKAIQGLYPGMQKTSGSIGNIALNPKELPTSSDAASTIGHEMLHLADHITSPDFPDAYRFSNSLPGDYMASSHEVRARLQGAKTKAYFEGMPKRNIEVSTDLNGNSYINPKLDPRISNLPPEPTVPASVINESPEDKLYRLIRDRQQNPTPRVPTQDKTGGS